MKLTEELLKEMEKKKELYGGRHHHAGWGLPPNPGRTFEDPYGPFTIYGKRNLENDPGR